jgi:hypothetical protein
LQLPFFLLSTLLPLRIAFYFLVSYPFPLSLSPTKLPIQMNILALCALIACSLAVAVYAAPIEHVSEHGRALVSEHVVHLPSALCDGRHVHVPSATAATIAKYVVVECANANPRAHLRFVYKQTPHTSIAGVTVLHTRRAPVTEILQSLHVSQRAFCVGFNADGSCSTAAQQIPLFSAPNVNVVCEDCFVGFSGDFVLGLDLWRREFEIGFSNLTLDWAAVLQATAQKSWSVGVNKDWTVATIDILDTKIGLIPIHVYVTIPLNLQASLTVDGTAQADLGVKGHGDLGSLLASYKDGHWTHVTPSPVWSFDVVKQLSYDAKADAHAQLVPQLQLHVDDVFDGNLLFEPSATAHVELSGSPKPSLCVSASVEAKAEWTGEVKLDWIKVDKTWDKVLFDEQKQIVNTC